MDPPPVVRAPQSLEELVHRDVQRGVLVIRTRLGPDDRSLDVAGDLDPVTGLGLAWVGFVGHNHVEPLNARRELGDLGQLVIQVSTETVRDLDVPAGDYDLHRCPPWGIRGIGRGPAQGPVRRGTTSTGEEPQAHRRRPQCWGDDRWRPRKRRPWGPCMNARPTPAEAIPRGLPTWRAPGPLVPEASRRSRLPRYAVPPGGRDGHHGHVGGAAGAQRAGRLEQGRTSRQDVVEDQ